MMPKTVIFPREVEREVIFFSFFLRVTIINEHTADATSTALAATNAKNTV